jgi:hypothetical protein
MSNVKDAISEMLQEYDELFYSDVMKVIRKEYPRYVALYTPVLIKPDFAIIGTNPSWFVGEPPNERDLKDEECNRTNSLKGVHDINAYIAYPEPTYHKAIKRFFSRFLEKKNISFSEELTNIYIEDNVMGWNSQFIQTGSAGLGDLKKICTGNPNLENILKKANYISKNILELVKPSVVIHFGKPSALASGSYQDKNLETLRASNPKNTRHGGKRVVFHHPSQGYSNIDRDEDIDLLIDLLSKRDVLK